MKAYSWGRLPYANPATLCERDWRFELLPSSDELGTLLAQGCQRSYGDVGINSGAAQLSTARLNRFIRFDAEEGVLECEAGVTLNEILQLIVPQGWFLPVLPGTRFVSVGGAIANDVHGKNHHFAGSFGCHVRSLTLLRSDESRPQCSPEENAALFAATIGGLGLTGLITSAELSLQRITSSNMCVEDIACSSLAHFLELSRESADWDFTVSWIDTSASAKVLGKGIFSRARHVESAQKLEPGASGTRIAVPFTPPVSLVNKLTVNCFNRLYHYAGSRKLGQREVPYQRYFFPLDAVAQWNRAYGPRGFYQYQCVVPHKGAEKTLGILLENIRASGAASFLNVLKIFGDKQSPGLLSFTRPGITLAVDFPNHGEKTLSLFRRMDEAVLGAGGAVYPAKDARMPAQLFSAGYPSLDLFKASIDPAFSSSFWRRVQE